MSAGRRLRCRDVIVAAGAFLAWLLLVLTAPDDGWGHAQPRTMAYAVDLATGGPPALPRDEAGGPSTKPPLHPWLVAPVVAALGPGSWIVHRWPDLAAAAGVAIALVVCGRRWWPRSAGHVGAVAATAWIGSFIAAKTAALARPDMLLTAGVTLAWLAATDAAVRAAGPASSSSAAAVPSPGSRGCVAAGAAIGGLAKGPAVLLLAPGLWLGLRWAGAPGRRVLRGLVCPAVLAGALLPPLAWLAWAHATDPAWVRHELVGAEVLARITGELPDAGGGGPWTLVATATYMPAYLLLRFLPWTVPLVLAAALTLWPALSVRSRGRRPADVIVPRMALGLVAATVLVFTLSAGKRADYLAPCLPAAAMAAAWWLVRGDRATHPRAPWAVPLSAAVVLALLAVHHRRPNNGVPAAFGEAVAEVAAATRRTAAAQELRVATLGSAETSLPLRVGRVPADPPWRFGELVAEGRAFLLVHASMEAAPGGGPAWARAHPGVEAVEPLVVRGGPRSEPPDGQPWPGPGSWEAWVVLVRPRGPEVSPGAPPGGFKGTRPHSR